MGKKDTASFLLPSFLLQVVFPRIQILKNKKLLAMFTCVSQSGLKLFPKKGSVSKPLPLRVLASKLCYVRLTARWESLCMLSAFLGSVSVVSTNKRTLCSESSVYGFPFNSMGVSSSLFLYSYVEGFLFPNIEFNCYTFINYKIA